MDLIKEVNLYFSSKFDMKDLGATHFILGMEIKRDRAGRRVWLNQSKYVETILKRINIKECKLVMVPILVGIKLFVEQCSKTHEETEQMTHVPYAIFVGSSMHAMVCTLPDIFHAVGVLS